MEERGKGMRNTGTSWVSVFQELDGVAIIPIGKMWGGRNACVEQKLALICYILTFRCLCNPSFDESLEKWTLFQENAI